MSMIDLLIFGTKKNLYIEDATDTGTGNDKFDSTTLQEYEVPAGKRWLLLGGVVVIDANATCTVSIMDRSDKLIRRIIAQTATTGTVPYPSTNSSVTYEGGVAWPHILDEGEYVQILFGAAQGAGASASCQVIEVSI